MSTRCALVTGITGQDGSYLAELLLSKGYLVIGMVRRGATSRLQNLAHLQENQRLRLVPGDLTDSVSLVDVLTRYRPQEIYNLGAQSFVGDSWRLPELTMDVTGLGLMRLLEAARRCCPQARIYQASSSELFGKVQASPQSEQTPFYPRSPYGIAKQAAHWYAINARESYGLFVCCGILFNHESPRRGLEFVTRKIAHGVAQIKYGVANELVLGNLQAKRDWGFAGDYVEAMWRMLQQDHPRDFVIGTGETHTVGEFVALAFARAGIYSWQRYVRSDPQFMRPAEVDLLLADASAAREHLGWQPKTSFVQLVHMMVDAELNKLNTGT